MVISQSERAQVVARAKRRCEYCQTQQDVVIYMTVDHIVPQAAGGASDLDNLCLCCPTCNGAKSDSQTSIDPETGQEVALYNPRTQIWANHFAWSEDKTRIIGLTPIGRATVDCLQMNQQIVVEARARWASWGVHPPHGG